MFMTTYSLEKDYFTGRELTGKLITTIEPEDEPKRLEYVPLWPLYVHSFSGILLMSASTFFHWFGCQSCEMF